MENLQDGNINVMVSGPWSRMKHGDRIYSRLLLLNIWLKEWYHSMQVGFIDNWDIHCLAKKKSHHFDLNQQIVVLWSGVASVGQV